MTEAPDPVSPTADEPAPAGGTPEAPAATSEAPATGADGSAGTAAQPPTDAGPSRVNTDADAGAAEGPVAGEGELTMRVWRGDPDGGEFTEYNLPAVEGEVVLDVIHRIQATLAPDLACRWNCKAGKCGSCSAEINGKPRLMCMTRMDTAARGPGDRRPDADLPDHPRPGHRRQLQLRGGQDGPGLPTAAPSPRAATACSRSTSSGARSSASASSASCARTSAT